MNISDYFTNEQLNIFEKEIFKKSGLNVSVFDQEGAIISSYSEWANKLCPVIRGNEKSKNIICTTANNNISLLAKNSGKAVIEECDAGLVKFSVPVFSGEKFLGTISGCGLLSEDENSEVDSFLLNKMAGLNTDEVMKLSQDIKSISNEKLNSVVNFIESELNNLIK